jgi:hypothetical protein
MLVTKILISSSVSLTSGVTRVQRAERTLEDARIIGVLALRR